MDFQPLGQDNKTCSKTCQLQEKVVLYVLYYCSLLKSWNSQNNATNLKNSQQLTETVMNSIHK